MVAKSHTSEVTMSDAHALAAGDREGTNIILALGQSLKA